VGANSSTRHAVEKGRSSAQHLVEGYLSHLAHERRLSPHTVEHYGRDVAALVRLAEETPLAQLKPHQVRRYVARLHGQGLGGRTLARMLSAWRGFFHYLARDHGYAVNPCVGLRAPRAGSRLPHALSPDEAGRLMEAGADDALGVRDRAILELLYSSGLRLSELTALRVQDVDFRDGTVRVTGKGAKTRIVPVGSRALAALQAWLPQRSGLTRPDVQAMFVARHGRAMSPRGIQSRVHGWGLRLGVPGRVHPHVLRHTFASHVLQSSGDLRAVQELLGHASISTTQVYTHLDFQHLAKVYDEAHPRARRKAK
jgi:integrase/recombinase XerC